MNNYPFIIQVKRLWGTTNGIALWPFIFVDDKENRTLVEHEKIHIKQAEKGRVIGFYLKYIYYHFKYGYKNNPYEIEAYAHQDDWRKP
jgi:hypothetical protein